MAEKKSRRGIGSESNKSEPAPTLTAVPEEKKAPPKAPPKAAPAPVVKPKSRAPLVPFARWFNARKFKPHWKAGMAVHAGDLRARRTPEEWDKLFEAYGIKAQG